MKTKYIKVSVSDRLPKQEKSLILIDEFDTSCQGYLSANSNWIIYSSDSYGSVQYWLEEIEDREGELLHWKESASKVMNNIDLQKVGKILGVPLGQDISSQILPSIEMLIKENEQLKKMVSN